MEKLPVASQVDDLLAQFSDETLLQLSLPSTNASLIHSSGDDCILGSELAARFAKLRSSAQEKTKIFNNDDANEEASAKSSSACHHNEEEDDDLGLDLARRLAALKAKESVASSRPSNNNDLPSESSADLTRPLAIESSNPDENRGLGEDVEPIVSDVGALLASLRKEFRAESRPLKQKKKRSKDKSVLQETCDSEEEILDAEVDEVVEWAKDAARLDIPTSEDEELSLEATEADIDITLPSIKDDDSLGKKKVKGWSFWGRHIR